MTQRMLSSSQHASLYASFLFNYKGPLPGPPSTTAGLGAVRARSNFASQGGQLSQPRAIPSGLWTATGKVVSSP